MLSEGGMSFCPNLIAVSLPGKQSWAFEEISDTIFEKDQEAIINKTRYKGVFAIYLKKASLDVVVKNFLIYHHSFISRVVPVKVCNKNLEIVVESSLQNLPKGFIKLIIHLREPLKNKIKEDDISNLIINHGFKLTKKSDYAIVVENLEDLFVSASGIIRKCGSSCIIVY